MRINAYIAHHCPFSRRKADEIIAQGRVNINRKKALIGDMVRENDKVFVDGKLLKIDKDKKYSVIVYHKPKGEIVSKKDDRGRKTIYDSLGAKFSDFTPVGRLDFASEGLLILSDSKKVASFLMESDLEREYIIKINAKITNEMIEAMRNGLEIVDSKAGAHRLSKITHMSFAPFLDVAIIKNTPTYSRLKVIINEGKNRELRRFFAHFKADILDLRRVRYGWIHLNALPVGKVRYLHKDEYTQLHKMLKAKDSLV